MKPRTQPRRRHPWRRAGASLLVLCLLALAMGSARFYGRWPFSLPNAEIPLTTIGMAVDPDGTRSMIPPGSDLVYLEGSRVAVADPDLATPSELAAAAESRGWLAAGTIPGAGTEFEDMATDALLDIRALTLDDGAVVAGWPAKWHYAWPRDNAFVAYALARTGHVDDALEVLTFLQGVQNEDGSFEARYLPDGSGTPDDRGVQTDATGWALWSAAMVIAEIDDPVEKAEAARTLAPLITRSTTHILDLTGDGTRLPPPSPDYWEVPTGRTTLGTCAPLSSALTGAPALLSLLGEDALADRASTAATALYTVVRTDFAPNYGRFRTGDQVDTAVAFLLPPFATPQSDVLAAWHDAPEAMLRPAGGLAPGAGWRQDGVSWTPTTTVFAMTAAAIGEDDTAIAWLRWVDAHRSPLGAIPEKVLHDGSPAQLAPLAWSSANVLLALSYLDEDWTAPMGYLP